MDDPGGLTGLRGLHDDLLALEASRLGNIERLWADLEARVNEFRQLLDKPGKNEESRKALSSGMQSAGSSLGPCRGERLTKVFAQGLLLLMTLNIP